MYIFQYIYVIIIHLHKYIMQVPIAVFHWYPDVCIHVYVYDTVEPIMDDTQNWQTNGLLKHPQVINHWQKTYISYLNTTLLMHKQMS